MDVHPPDQAIHSWRDFFVHIATIVVGLLIALMLEQSVEWLHHRHMMAEAREQLQQELENNRRTLAGDERFLDIATNDGRYNLNLLMADHDPGKPLHFGWRWDATSASAWATAKETGAISLMPYSEVQELSERYAQQALLETEATSHIHDYVLALSPLSHHGNLEDASVASLTPQERAALVEGFSRNLTEIALLRDLLHGLRNNYARNGQHR